MPRPRLHRKAAALVLAGALLAPWLSASETRTPARRGRASAAVQAPWEALVRLWGVLVSVWEANGCRIDPNGCAADPNPQGGTSSGLGAGNICKFDPAGCASALEADNGCRIDPNGCAK